MTAILNAELLHYKSATVNEGSTNGGRLSSTAITNAVKGNVWPSITESQRTDGDDIYRKVFIKAAHTGRTTFSNVKVWLPRTTPGDGRVTLFAGTQRNTAADITGSERPHGVGTLVADTALSATSLQVDVEPGGGADEVFQDGDIIWVSDGANEEFAEIDTVTWSTDRASITLVSGLTHAYDSSTPTYVASCMEPGDVVATVDNYVKTGGFTYNDSTYPVLGDGIGSIEQTWTLTFTSGTAFSVSGDTVGSVGTGSISSPFSPSNADFSQPYFTIPTAAWGGTPVTGNTMVFQTHPAAVPCWLKMEIPAGSASISNDATALGISGESA